MRFKPAALALIGLVFAGCAAQPTTALDPRTSGSNSTGGGADQQAAKGTPPGTTTQSGNQTGASTSNQTGGSTLVPYTFAEAQAFCKGCHSATGSAASYWSKADGDESVWKTEEPTIRAAVQLNMPKGGGGIDKQRFYAFLDKLKGVTPGSNSGGSTTMPVALTFDTAKLVCVGCHGPGKSAVSKFALSDTDKNDWVLKKTKILGALNSPDEPMPPPSGITDAAAKQAFVDFINNLK